MADSIDQLRGSFVEETRDLINELEDILLSSDTESVSSEIIDQIFRSIHTIKGSGGMLGFDKVLAVTHDLEDIYDKVRSRELEFTNELKEISLETIDILKVLLASNEQISNADHIRFSDLCRRIHMFEVVTLGGGEGKSAETASVDVIFRTTITYFIEFEPGKSISGDISNTSYLFKELSLMGKFVSFTKKGRETLVNTFDDIDEKSSWRMVLSTREDLQTIENVFEWIKDDCDISIHEIITGDLLAVEDAKKEIEKLSDKIFKISYDDLRLLAENFSVDIIEEKPVGLKSKEKSSDDGQSANGTIKSIRVSTDKVDQLLGLVSEMVTLQARLNLLAAQSENPDMISVAEKYGTFAKQLRDNAFTISLVPFGITITRYKRMVHDLSEQLGKQVDFVTEGEDTALDKKIIEQLSDPIMHILRNSVDHGIETAEERVANGKPAQGRILMKIFHQSNNVIIKIADDGKGIDVEEIRKIGIRKKIIRKESILTNEEVLGLIFLPGFSSAKSISNVSGRGVGLDVVKNNISDIRGTITVDTELGKGSVFSIRLPLTLSIIDGLQVNISDRNFIVPLQNVSKIYTLDKLEQESILRQVLVLDGEQVPYFNLREDFGIAGELPEKQEIVLVSYDKEKVALIVDSVIGENQTVLKSLGRHYKNQDFISGGTILGDGSVALVLDINKIVTGFSKYKK